MFEVLSVASFTIMDVLDCVLKVRGHGGCEAAKDAADGPAFQM